MSTTKFDAIIIGTGQAGPPLAGSLAKHGLKIAIIEKGQLGGTCVNVGCTPTKAYVASARRAFIAKNSKSLGIEVKGEIVVNLKTIKARKDQIIQDSRNGLHKMLTETENISLIKGTAKFEDEHTVSVDGKKYSADKIYINVGGRARILEGFSSVPFLTNKSILDLEEIPEHLIIVGGGYIGLEFGQMFRRFGSKVTILESGDKLLKREDDEFAEEIAEILKKEGVDIRLNSECISAKKKGDQIEVSIECTEGAPTLKGSHLLVAAGRVPNTDTLGLDKIGMKLDKRGYIKVNDELKTNIEHIWALGDCNGEGAFTHTAYNDFQIVNSHLFQDKKRKLSDRFLCYAAFIDPPISRVGLNEKDIKEKGIKAKVATIKMSKIARAKEMGETQGMLKILIDDKTDKVLGATFLGIGADEYIHTIIDLMYADAPYTVIRDAVHIHPTVSELIPTMLENPKPLE